LIYNGMEVGDATESTAPALFETRKIEWEPVGRPPVRDLYRSLIAFRKQNQAMASGDLVWLENSRPQEVVSFLRKAEGQEILVAINLSSRPVEVAVRAGEPAVWEKLEFPGDFKKGTGIPARMQLPGFGWGVLKKKGPKR